MIKVKFSGVLQTRDLPELPKNPNKFAEFFKHGHRSTTLKAQAIHQLEKQREALRAFHTFHTVCANVIPGFKVERSAEPVLDNPIVWDYDRVASEFASLVDGAKESLPPTTPALVREYWEKVRKNVAVALLSHSDFSDSDRILTLDGWTKALAADKKTEVWENKHHPGITIKISSGNFIITKGATIIQPQTPINKLEEVLTAKKKDGTMPGSITNTKNTL